MEVLNKILEFLGGGAVVAIAIIYFLSNRIADRLAITWKTTGEKNLATLQSELAKNNAILNNVITLYGSNHNQAQERRIKAIEILWINVLEYKHIVPTPAHFFYNALTKDEISNYLVKNSSNKKIMEDLSRLNDIDESLHTIRHMAFIIRIEKERPFLGEKIWASLEIYKIFLGRIYQIVLDGWKKGKIDHWYEDAPLKNLFQSIFSKEEVNYIYSNMFSSLMIATTFLEGKLLHNIHASISGEEFSDNVLDRVRTFEKSISDILNNRKP